MKPKRIKADDPIEQDLALMHWHFEYEGKSKLLPGKPWMEKCMARNIRSTIEQGILVVPKDEKEPRAARAGDFAVLCRSNAACQVMAEALHSAGLKAAIARNGLMQTPEAKLILGLFEIYFK